MTAGVTVTALGGLFVSLCVLAIILLVVLGLLTKWRAWRRAVGVVLLIMFGLPAVLFAARAVIVRFGAPADMQAVYVPSHRRAEVPSRAQEADLPMAPMAQVTTSWSEAMDRTFTEADLHPSPRAAAKALCWQVENWAEANWADAEIPMVVEVGGPASLGARELTRDLLRQRFPVARIDLAADATTRPAGALNEGPSEHTGAASIDEWDTLETFAAIQTAKQKARAGMVTVTVRRQSDNTGGPQFKASASYTDKAWVDDFAAFASDEPDREWLVAYSPKVTDSRHDAHQQVLRAAAAKLRPYLRDYLRRDASGRGQQFAWWGVYVLDEPIETALRSSELIADRFVQSVRRPYGDVWREALLMDASADTFAAVGAACVAHLEARRDYYKAKEGSERVWWMRMVLSIAGLVALICVMYLFLNFATKGYYVWALRGAAVVIAAAAVLFALKFW